jgi:hypothetical protein
LKGQIIINPHWFTKDEKTIDWREGFPQLPLNKKSKHKEGSWEALGFESCVFVKEGKCVYERITSLLCVKKCCSWKQMVCKQKNMEKGYVYQIVIVEVHGIISMN